MKKSFLVLVVAFTLISCSSSDDHNNNSNNNAFNPPTWIHGTWSFDETIVNGFVFTNNSFCSINGTQETCFPEQESAGYDVNEDISETDYTITIIQSAVGQVIQTNSYHFIKVDSDNIEFDDPILDNRMMFKID
ncbi:MAG: hypothetical protein KDC67_14340 [Ignavibacteriae bacterium]|nr:hypothetical protein [Ignavibacteriota bacterium]